MHIQPKKSLGQNFLIDKNIQKKIISAINLTRKDVVLEIGAGRGDLTSQLALSAGKVYALEIDERLYPALEQNLGVHANCQVIKGDILKFDINKFLRENKIKQKIKVIGNIPYYISSPIIQLLINYRKAISAVYITVQKEFGRRVVSLPGSKEYGSFSCFTQYYARCRILFEIKKGSFRPVPKIDSCFLSLEFRDKPPVLVKDEEIFFKLIRTAFNQRRKTLRNSLDGFMDLNKLEKFLDSSGIDRNVRPECLSLEQFALLEQNIQKSS